MTYIVSGGALNSTHSLTHSLGCMCTDTYNLDQQWEIPISAVKSNYFGFATIMLNFTHNEFLNIIDFKPSDYHSG